MQQGFSRWHQAPPVSGTESATASHSSTLSMRPSRSRSQLTPAPAIAMLPSRAYCGGSWGPSWYACVPAAQGQRSLGFPLASVATCPLLLGMKDLHHLHLCPWCPEQKPCRALRPCRTQHACGTPAGSWVQLRLLEVPSPLATRNKGGH